MNGTEIESTQSIDSVACSAKVKLEFLVEHGGYPALHSYNRVLLDPCTVRIKGKVIKAFDFTFSHIHNSMAVCLGHTVHPPHRHYNRRHHSPLASLWQCRCAGYDYIETVNMCDLYQQWLFAGRFEIIYLYSTARKFDMRIDL